MKQDIDLCNEDVRLRYRYNLCQTQTLTFIMHMCTWDTDTTLCETQTLDFMQQRRMHQSIHFPHYYVKTHLMGEFINKQNAWSWHKQHNKMYTEILKPCHYYRLTGQFTFRKTVNNYKSYFNQNTERAKKKSFGKSVKRK